MTRRRDASALTAPLAAGSPVAILPTASVMLASLITALPIMADSPMLPPCGLLMLLAWRLMRSDMWPVWIGIPLGLWDDLFSGQPVGSAIALWTMVMLAMDAVDLRLVWRDYRIDWLIGALAIAFVLVAGGMLALAGDPATIALLVAPQFGISLFALPAAMLLVARLDSWRIRR